MPGVVIGSTTVKTKEEAANAVSLVIPAGKLHSGNYTLGIRGGTERSLHTTSQWRFSKQREEEAVMSFVYTANALAFGGALEKPCCEHHSESGLGGSRAERRGRLETVRNFNYKGIITFDEASVYVAGSQNGRYRNTVATALIRNLNLMNMVHIELLCARVTSEHLAVDEKEQSPCEEPEFTFEGSIIDNVQDRRPPHEHYA